MKVAVIKYNAGNIRSVDYALKRLGIEAVITADEAVLRAADKVILSRCGRGGNYDELFACRWYGSADKRVASAGAGHLLGMQLMCRHSEEGDVDCLGILILT